MIILKQLNGKAIWLLDTLNQDSIEKKLARMYSTAYVNSVLCRQVYSGLEMIFGNLPVKMTSTNEFVSVIKQNVLVILPQKQEIS